MKNSKKRLLSLILVIVALFGLIIPAGAENVKVPLGDADVDGQITAADARIVLRMAVGIEDYNDNMKKICDANSNGKIEAEDARLVLRASVGLENFDGKTVTVKTDTSDTEEKDSSIFQLKAPSAPKVSGGSDTFSFTVYGYGHGVGMSQWGAVIMANAGYNYKEILSYYYKNSYVYYDVNYPETVNYNGEECSTEELVARITYQEIAGIASDDDAIKAQAVAVFTLIRYYSYNATTNNTGVAASSYDKCSDKVKNAVSEVFGEYVTLYSSSSYKPVLTVYSAFTAGASVDCSYTWGGSYPVSVASPFEYSLANQTLVYRYLENGVQTEIVDSKGNTVYIRNASGTVVKDTRTSKQREYFAVVYIYSSEAIKSKILAYDETAILSENPEEWFDILAHNSSIDSSRGYVKQIRVGDFVLSGVGKLSSALKLGFRSGCYTVKYNK